MPTLHREITRLVRPDCSPASPRRLSLFLSWGLAATLLTSVPLAQTGAFTDGELLVRAPQSTSTLGALYRVDAVTGEAAALLLDVYPNYSKGGWVAYDPYRGALLAYCAIEAFGIFAPRLLQIESDGSYTDLGFVGEGLRCLAPMGDGRVYCYRGTTLHVLDASNAIAPVLDAGGLEIELGIEHLAYDPPSHSLIGVGNTTTGCGAFGELPIHRLPLAPDGASVAGPQACSTFFHGTAAAPVGIDPLPGGTLLVTLAGLAVASLDDRFLEVDPATLATSVWAESPLSDLDGGVWVPSLGGAVALDDGDNVLRLFFESTNGEGIVIPTSEPMGNVFSGWSSSNALADIDLLGPGCGGLAKSFGVGLAGSGGFAPTLGASSCPRLGATLTLEVSAGLGGSAYLLVFGLAGALLPVAGGELYVLPPFAASVIGQLSGSAGQAGAGSAQAQVQFPALPALIGIPVFSQALVSDSGAPFGWTFSPGLELRAE